MQTGCTATPGIKAPSNTIASHLSQQQETTFARFPCECLLSYVLSWQSSYKAVDLWMQKRWGAASYFPGGQSTV